MRLITPALSESELTFENDCLDRRDFGQALLNLVTRSDDELVICLDAPWGEGKTTFIKMWQNLLRDNGVHSVYFDAFANDYVDDAFIALTSLIVSFVENDIEHNNSAKKILNKFKSNAGRVGAQLLTIGSRVAIKAATFNVIGESELSCLAELKESISDDASEFASKLIEDRIASHKCAVDAIKSFRKTLEDIAAGVSVQSNKPLVIIIDELDRCKPTYALEVLEKVKHIFSVKNVVFVLAMHKQQMASVIKCIYGADVDAMNYLHKFVNVSCELPKQRGGGSLDNYELYCRRLIDVHGLVDISNNSDMDELQKYVSYTSRVHNLSLRQIERMFVNISVFYSSIDARDFRVTQLVALLATYKIINHDLYTRLKLGVIPFDQFEAEVESSIVFYESGSDVHDDIISWFRFGIIDEQEYVSRNYEFREHRVRLQGGGVSRTDVIRYHCNLFDAFKVSI